MVVNTHRRAGIHCENHQSKAYKNQKGSPFKSCFSNTALYIMFQKSHQSPNIYIYIYLIFLSEIVILYINNTFFITNFQKFGAVLIMNKYT